MTNITLDPLRVVSLVLAVITLVSLLIANRRINNKFISKWLVYVCAHIVIFYTAVFLNHISLYTSPIEAFFTSWSAALRLHELLTFMLISRYLILVSKNGDQKP
jgi:uncharacterized membrane protein